jgi:hypothetical protein
MQLVGIFTEGCAYCLCLQPESINVSALLRRAFSVNDDQPQDLTLGKQRPIVQDGTLS